MCDILRTDNYYDRLRFVRLQLGKIRVFHSERKEFIMAFSISKN